MRAALPALPLLTACAAPGALPEELAPPPAAFVLDLSEPILGEPLVFSVTGAQPGQLVSVLRSFDASGGRCYRQIGGQCLDLTPRLRLVWRASADGSGAITVEVPLPDNPALAGVDVCFQALSRLGVDGADSEIGAPVCVTFDYDSDGDGVNDSGDRCPGFDDAVDRDDDGEPDACDDTPDGPITGPPLASCTAHYDAGQRADGMYLVDPLDTGAPKVVWCDMSDGGWTLVLRGYGGSGWGSAWNETGAIDPAGVPSPEMAESFKLSDDEINALRGWAGPYRLEYTGTASPVAPPTAYVSGLCSYRHDADLFAETFANRACRTWSLASDLSSPVVSQTNHYRRGVVVGSATVGSGFLSYLTNFVEGTPERDGWYAGDIATENGFCLPSTPGCDIAMYVRAAEGAPARASCSDHLDAGATADGVYQVDPLGTGAFPVYCDMSDGGWALVARGVGGDNAADQWNTTGAIDPGVAPSPTMTRTMKLSDVAINALRQGGGRYRVQYNGTTNVFSPPPPTVYVPGTCAYDHVSPAGGACLSWSSSSNLSGLQTSLTNAARKAIVVGSTTAGTGLIHYLVNFYQVGGALNGWYAGDITQNSDWCHAGQAGCDVVMWVSGR